MIIYNAPNLWKEKVTEDSEVTFSNMRRLLPSCRREQVCGLDPMTCSLGFMPSVLSCSSASAFSAGQVSVPAPGCPVCSGFAQVLLRFTQLKSACSLPWSSHCRHQLTDTHLCCTVSSAPPFSLLAPVCVWFLILHILWNLQFFNKELK